MNDCGGGKGESSMRSNNFLRLLPLIYMLILLVYPCIARGETKYPKPRGAINDFAEIIPPDQERKMTLLAHEVLQKTGTAIVVATVETVGDSNPFTYANELYQAWGIGKKGEDKGVLVFLTVKERKLRIETGYGVEGILPDGLVGQIMDDHMVPFLKKNQFEMGLMNGTAALAGIIAKDAGVKLTGQVTYGTSRPRRSRGFGFLPILFFIILFFILSRSRGGILPLLLLMMMGGGRGFGGSGGGFGGFGGGFGGFGGGLSGGGGGGRSF